MLYGKLNRYQIYKSFYSGYLVMDFRSFSFLRLAVKLLNCDHLISLHTADSVNHLKINPKANLEIQAPSVRYSRHPK